ncbi:hypothetical protein KDA_68330 [Dictyobacter alpinus]|uniref:HEAT repeat domain-containing protein n=1 Tax=Dictyobacter alpinus TaxID=2014873 RepID=A0A402BJ36_9CHLR|nr:HEAT repeat domain-containing protein [Dictyobacter alpinus]GCE31349.1 hypothetical protein KDA_68330 [Dictyobacter alpinus]
MNWHFKYISTEEVYPEELSGTRGIANEAWWDWITDGHHATMGQLARAIEVRQEPTRRLAWVKSVMVLVERSGRDRMARNALIVLANTQDPTYLPLIQRATQDINPLIRASAVHALIKLGDEATAATLRHDSSPMVQHEVLNALHPPCI